MRIIHVINSSTVQANYQFDMELGNHSVFTLDQPVGTLPAKGSLTLRLRFRPHHPIAYHKKAACLLLHRVCPYGRVYMAGYNYIMHTLLIN